ncbi:MAG: DUF2442 domain-containing protein [Bryobacteraceae bacterium]
MLKDVIEVRPLDGHRLWLRFDDGLQGEIDLRPHLEFSGVFAPLKDAQYFARVAVHPEFKVVTWPNGADLDSDVLYSLVAGTPISVNEPAAR